ncbi:MAG: DUF3108 domain-containing protein [Bacteroidota bacterium]
MGKINKWLILNCLLLVGSIINSAQPEHVSKEKNSVNTDPCIVENTAFQSGEYLTYKIFYNWNFIWLPAGEIHFEVIDDNDQYHYRVVGKTYDSYSWLYIVEDYFDSWVKKSDLLPRRSIKSIREGKYRLYDDLTFDQSNRRIYNERGKAIDDIRERHNFEVNSCMHDMVSILYYCRNIDFSESKIGEKLPIKIFADKETWPLSVTYKGKSPAKKIKGKGIYNTLQFSPEVIEGDLFPDDAQVNVWVTDDANKMPLVIESPLSVGSVKAVLKDFKNLRYDLSAQVND